MMLQRLSEFLVEAKAKLLIKYDGELSGIVEIWTSEGIIGDDLMARMTCKCGAYLSNHEAPNDIQLRVYTDRE